MKKQLVLKKQKRTATEEHYLLVFGAQNQRCRRVQCRKGSTTRRRQSHISWGTNCPGNGPLVRDLGLVVLLITLWNWDCRHWNSHSLRGSYHLPSRWILLLQLFHALPYNFNSFVMVWNRVKIILPNLLLGLGDSGIWPLV